MGVEEGRGKKEYASSVSRERERERERGARRRRRWGERGDVVVQVRGESDEVNVSGRSGGGVYQRVGCEA